MAAPVAFSLAYVVCVPLRTIDHQAIEPKPGIAFTSPDLKPLPAPKPTVQDNIDWSRRDLALADQEYHWVMVESADGEAVTELRRRKPKVQARDTVSRLPLNFLCVTC